MNESPLCIYSDDILQREKFSTLLQYSFTHLQCPTYHQFTILIHIIHSMHYIYYPCIETAFSCIIHAHHSCTTSGDWTTSIIASNKMEMKYRRKRQIFWVTLWPVIWDAKPWFPHFLGDNICCQPPRHVVSVTLQFVMTLRLIYFLLFCW